MKYCSISKRFLVVDSSDSNVGHLKIGVIEQSEISHLNWLKWLATEVFLLLRISNRWLWNLCLRERFVWPMYCKPQLSHSIKYIKLFELQLMLYFEGLCSGRAHNFWTWFEIFTSGAKWPLTLCGGGINARIIIEWSIQRIAVSLWIDRRNRLEYPRFRNDLNKTAQALSKTVIWLQIL